MRLIDQSRCRIYVALEGFEMLSCHLNYLLSLQYYRHVNCQETLLAVYTNIHCFTIRQSNNSPTIPLLSANSQVSQVPTLDSIRDAR